MNYDGQSALSAEQIKVLMQRINSNRVKKRTIQDVNLSYVEAWDIKASLTRVFGFGGFAAEVLDSKIIQIREVEAFPQHVYRTGRKQGQAKTPVVIAQSTVRLTIFAIGPNGEDAVYTETAIGSNSGWEIGDAADNAIKSAASDALKRAASYLGTQFGLSLYAGTTDDVIRVLLNPTQAALWKSENTADDQTQEQLDRALGNGVRQNVPVADGYEGLPGEDPEVAAAQAAAEASQDTGDGGAAGEQS